jgi:hypothetical protein
MKPIKLNANLLIISLIYLSLIFSQGTQNTRYFQEWISGMVHGNFFSLYHVVPNVGALQTDNLTVPYPPFSLYLLGLTAKLLILFGGEFQPVFLISSNLTSVIFTLATYLLLALWGKKRGNLSPIWYLLTPAVFLISPILGYQDSIMSFFILGALIAAEKDRYLLAGVFAAFAIFSKQLAVMPMFGLGLLILFTAQSRTIIRAITGFAVTSLLILSPFIATNTLAAYFHAQALASVHTMMSAQNPNLPWLISMFTRITSHGIFNIESYSASPYEIQNQALRQKIYLSFALLTISVIVTYLLFWSRKIGLKQISPLYMGAVSISAYNLFSFGVHENHVFMLIPVLFAMSRDAKSREIYFAASTALGVNLLSTGGLGMTFAFFPILATANGVLYSAIGLVCLALYMWAFLKLYYSNPSKSQS